ncbi:LacI family DNA-binding transcriptional regulator [Mycolicibacterium sp. ELW1]|uniref:LacI family DNA-binding transcriptional regulator n=1 Tax=Mycobacteriaceae TaxID=1762 RepID=UPI002570A785|nr:LacI family DNA-binding transcriptional regulator [Mycobacterium sp. ELW1]
MTIADIARRAGTSTAVVSYVLNPGSRPVSDALRARVTEAMDDLDYRPDRHARGLRRQSQWGQIGLLVPDLTFPLYAALAGSITRQGRARRQLVITGNTGFDVDTEAELVRGFADVGVDSLLVTGILDGAACARICGLSRIPVVWVHTNRDIVGAKVVTADHVQAGRLAVQHLIEHGRTSIAFVGGFTEQDTTSGDRDTVQQRYAGYQSVVGAVPRHVPTDLTLKGAYREVRKHLAASVPPDGIVVGTYGQAAAVLRALADSGLKVPDDVAVVAFDGDNRNAYGQIILTTVQQPLEAMTEVALDLALGLRSESNCPPALFEVSLSPGESCGCAVPPGYAAGAS